MNEILGFLPFFYLGFWGFQFSSVQVSKFKHDANTRQHQKLGMWQLTPTKQESRLEIQA